MPTLLLKNFKSVPTSKADDNDGLIPASIKPSGVAIRKLPAVHWLAFNP